MPKKNNTKQEDLAHILTTAIADEGYDVDTEVEREVNRLAKFIVNKEDLEEDDPFDDDNFYADSEDLFDDYGSEENDDDEVFEDEEE